MPQVTVGGVTFCNPDLTYREFRPLVPSSLVQHILALNPTVTRSSFTKRVIMGSYVHLIEDNRAKAIASGLKPRSRRTMRNKMREWRRHSYWHSQHNRDICSVQPQAAVTNTVSHRNSHVHGQGRIRFNKIRYNLPVIATADLNELRPATLMPLLLQENTSCPTHQFTREMIMASYMQLIWHAYGKTAGSGGLMDSPYRDWFDSWKADGYWDHQHSQDTGLGQLRPAQPQSTSQPSTQQGTTNVSSTTESDTSSASDDRIDDVPSEHESDSEGTPEDSDRHRAQVVSRLEHEDFQLQSSLPPPSSLGLASIAEVQMASPVPVSSMSIQPASPADSHSPWKLINSQATPGASQPLFSDQVDMTTQRAAMLVLSQAMAPEQTPPMPHPLPARPPTHFIGDEMFLLPDSRMFFLHKINVKSFSVELLKVNREVDVQKITAEVLLECYRTFINRFFPMARSGLKANVLSCITNNSNQEFLGNHTDTLARLASQPAGTVPVTMFSTVAADPMSYVNDLNSDTNSDVEILEVRVLRQSMSGRATAMQQDDSAVEEDSKERQHRERRRRSQATENTSAALERTLAQPDHPAAQLLIDNKLYTMPEATQFPLRNLSITSFSRALYNLNGHYHPRDLSHSLILKAYKSFIFSQYLEAGFDDKIHACRQLNWPAPPKAEAEYLRNLNILERTHNKALPGRALSSANVEAEPAAPAQAERRRVGEEEDTARIVTSSPEPRRAKQSKLSAEAIHSEQDVEAPLVRKRKKGKEGDESHSRHKKKRRATEGSGVGAGTPMLMSGALAFRPSPVPAALSAETTEGSPHKRRKKARKTKEEAS